MQRPKAFHAAGTLDENNAVTELLLEQKVKACPRERARARARVCVCVSLDSKLKVSGSLKFPQQGGNGGPSLYVAQRSYERCSG